MSERDDPDPGCAEEEFEFVGDGDSGWWFPKADLEAVRASPRSRRLAEILRKFARELRELGNASTRCEPEIGSRWRLADWLQTPALGPALHADWKPLNGRD